MAGFKVITEVEAANLAFFKGYFRHSQGVMLLKRLAYLFPQGQTFDRHVPVWIPGRRTPTPNPNGLAYHFPTNELSEADRYLQIDVWWELVGNGYVAEAPPQSGKYEITDKGWEVVESNTVEVEGDGLPF
jgi:hypothetical protein